NADARLRLAPGSDSNLLCFAAANEGEATSVTNSRAERLFEMFSPTKRGDFIVSKTTLQRDQYGKYLDQFIASWKGVQDADGLTLIRMCILNPFFDSKEMTIKFSDRLVASFTDALDDLDEVITREEG